MSSFSYVATVPPRCRNCGSPGHRSWECSEQKNVVSNIICTRCGGGGHIASDCKTDMYVCVCVCVCLSVCVRVLWEFVHVGG